MVKKKRVIRNRVQTVRRRVNRKVVAWLFVFAGILVLILLGLMLYNFGVFEKKEGPQLFNIKDECALVMGNLVHQVRDDGECRIKCVNECDVRDMDFMRFSFEGKNDDCNSCDCWCE